MSLITKFNYYLNHRKILELFEHCQVAGLTDVFRGVFTPTLAELDIAYVGG